MTTQTLGLCVPHNTVLLKQIVATLKSMFASLCFPRRKKVMDAVFKDEGGWRARFVHMFERLQDHDRRKKK